MVDDWKLFGVSLGVPLRKLNTIKLDDPHGGVENWKLKMFQFWLHYKPCALWKDVIQALKENDYNDLAATLSRKYPLQAEGMFIILVSAPHDLTTAHHLSSNR